MLFSDSSVTFSPSLHRTRPVQSGGLADENNASFYARIQQAKQAFPAVSPSLGAPSTTAEPTATQDSPVEPAGGFQQFQQQFVRMWRRWKKGILIGGSLLATATLGVSAFWLTKHLSFENQKTNLIPERGEFAHLWGRFQEFERHIEQMKALSKEALKGSKIEGGYGLVKIFQDALEADKFVCNETSSAQRNAQASRMLKTLLDYALDYEPDVLPTLIRDLHARKRITEFLTEEQVPAIETPFRAYIKQHQAQFDSDPLLKASYEGYLNDRRAVEVFKQYDIAEDAKNVVQQALLFLQSRTANQPESHLEMACMLDLYATYLKQYHPQAYDALAPLANNLKGKTPMSPSTFTPEDLAGLAGATFTNYRQAPWQSRDESIHFSECLRDLMNKIMAREPITPQNHVYHQKMREG